jgi:cellulose biosynthesis protein BcsQ
MSTTRSDRRVVTFYSYKGGAGRTMALANVAFRLADLHALNVVAVDWDLEAPGLHTFFGIDAAKTGVARGVLDYLESWTDAASRGDSAPPDVTNWLIPVDMKPGAPRHGSLSLLLAGRLDESYETRLAGLDWAEFYANRGGALAVETLRRQLVAKADVVLIDSRTGLTDAGGICTVQLPDGVVLMASPNRQSMDGIERVARSIRGASSRERAGRGAPRTWLSICRVPSVEETFLSDRWFAEHEGWFQRCVEQKLWKEEDHRRGIRTYEIPHRARWGFDEILLSADSVSDPREPLSLAYDTLTVALLAYCVAPFEPLATNRPFDLDTLRRLLAEAEQRKDIDGILTCLANLGNALGASDRHDDAIDLLQRGVGMAEGADRPLHQAGLGSMLGTSLARAGRLNDSSHRHSTY